MSAAGQSVVRMTTTQGPTGISPSARSKRSQNSLSVDVSLIPDGLWSTISVDKSVGSFLFGSESLVSW